LTSLLTSANNLAKDGCYVLGMAYAELLVPQSTEKNVWVRENTERQLNVLGLVLFRNELKADTKDSLSQLKSGSIRTFMITGDNAICGAYIARQSGMIGCKVPVYLGRLSNAGNNVEWRDMEKQRLYTTGQIRSMAATSQGHRFELAVNGDAFTALADNIQSELLFHIRIFARMTPYGKVDVISRYMERGVITGMCGDGGNGCGALRQAHVGVALSEVLKKSIAPISLERVFDTVSADDDITTTTMITSDNYILSSPAVNQQY
jgi:magnesium-transporting ATPase (P-type)